MKAGWKRVKLGEIAEVLLGKMLDQKKNRGKYYPFLNNVAVRWGGFDLEGLGQMRFEEDELERYKIKQGDIVVCEGGESGRCAMWKDTTPILYQKALHRVRVTGEVDQCFLYHQLFYTFKSGKADALITGSTIKHLPRQAMLEVQIDLPPLPTQRRIAALLGALDDKIELNRKMNANLEAQAQALFKSWFVDFAPWGGKMPKEWKKIPLSEIADFHPGYSYKGNELRPSRVAMATIKNYERRGGFKLDGFKEIVPSSKLKESQSVEVFDTLVAHTDMTQNADVIGNAEIVLSNGGYDKLIMSMDLVKVVPKHGISRFLIAALLKNPVFKAHCLGYVNGTTVLHMSKSALAEHRLFFPSDAKGLGGVSKSFETIYRMMAMNIEESRKLAETRDALLPKLMSGEVEVG